MDEPTEEISPFDVGHAVGLFDGSETLGCLQLQSSMRASPVVVLHIDPKDAIEMPGAEDQQPIQALCARSISIRLERIDPDTNTVVASVDLRGRPISAIAADPTAVWAVAITEPSDEAGEWTGNRVRTDTATNEIVAEIPLGPQMAGYEDEVMLGAGSVWVLGVRSFEKEDAEYGSDLIRIDPATNEIAARIPIGGFHPAGT